MRVRSARPSDAAAIGQIKRDGWRAAYEGLIPQEVLDALDAEELAADFRQGISELEAGERPAWAFLVAENDGEVVGYVICGPYRWDELEGFGEVYALYVDPAAWGSGAGRALMAAAEQALRARGHVDGALWVLEGNQAGRAFYEAVGWRFDGATDARCEVENAPEVRYRRRLAD